MNNIKSLETVLSELSDEKKKRIESVEEVLSIGDTVKVEIIKISDKGLFDGDNFEFMDVIIK